MLCSFLFRYPHNPVNARVYRSVGPLETSHLLSQIDVKNLSTQRSE
jgi:hypothetical protein